ncbi:hypothetical protein PIB30_069421 [Stylosanthes scabra]|uniref:Uncharacterized protein n=1 Tax=Stylosanthes scabra TaxID=79078 RepID=A0ABU6QMR8_9FABA|nr:hypothetical protein [Stylosanthes scabra]
MAPEYLIRGQLTDKADVYSFVVLVLQIVCGRRNNVFREDSGSLLQTIRLETNLVNLCQCGNLPFLQQVWKLYKSNTLAEAVDSSLAIDDYPTNEALRVLHIGLLCTQASASLRPSMAQVVNLLTNSNIDVPTPTQPPFMNTGVPDSDSSVRSYRTNSFVSNALKKIGVSNSFTESSSLSSSDRPSRIEEPNVQT